MSFLIKNDGSSAVQIIDDYVDVTLAAGETLDIENIYMGELWRLTFSAQTVIGGGGLLTAINNGDVVRRNQGDTADVPIANAFDDAIWLWHLTRQEKDALVGSYGTVGSANVFVTDTDPRMTNTRQPTPHAASHLPSSGSDYLTTGIAVSVGATNGSGSADAFARADHVHQGVHGIRVTTGGSYRYSDITFTYGPNLTISDNGTGSFTFDATPAATTELLVTDPSSGTYIVWNGGNSMYDGVVYAVSSGSGSLPTNSSLYVYVTTSGSVAWNTTGYPANSTPMSFVVTNGSIVTNVQDTRTFLNQALEWGLVGDVTTILPDDTASAGSSERYAHADHKHAIAAAVPKFLGETGRNTVTTEGSSTSFSRADHGHSIQTVTSFAGLPAAPVNGQLVWAAYGVYNGLFYYDSTRAKWLSLETQFKHWNSGTNVATATVNMVNNVDDTQQDNDIPIPYTTTVTGLMGSQVNAITLGNSTRFEIAKYNLGTGTITQDIADVTLSTVADRAVRSMSLNVDIEDMVVLSARRVKTGGTDRVTRPALSCWFKLRLA